MALSRQKVLLGIGLLGLVLAVVGVLYATNGQGNTDDTVEIAQMPHVGLLVPYSEAESLVTSAIAANGYREGENIEYTSLLALTTDDIRTQGQALLEQNVDIIIVLGADSALILSELTTTTPIVFMGSEGSYSDQVLVHMTNQAEKTNITGVLTTNFTERRFDILLELDPTIETVLVPYETGNLVSITLLEDVTAKGEAEGVAIISAAFSTTDDVDNLLTNLPPDIDAIFLGSERLALNAAFQWSTVALENGILLSIPFGEAFSPQVLMGYGTSFDAAFQQAARLTVDIIEGANPADLPIEYTELRLVISLGAAEALGLDVPNSILEQASQILRDDVQLTNTNTFRFDGGCNAQLSSVLGTSEVCVQASCTTLVDSSLIQYTNKIIVDSCSQQNIIGTCAAQGTNMYFYTGDTTALASGCQLNGGVWTLAESTPNTETNQ